LAAPSVAAFPDAAMDGELLQRVFTVALSEILPWLRPAE
jgi:hypothetical protein